MAVEEKMIVEWKCADRFPREHLAPSIHCLKASGLGAALRVNFRRPELAPILWDPQIPAALA